VKLCTNRDLGVYTEWAAVIPILFTSRLHYVISTPVLALARSPRLWCTAMGAQPSRHLARWWGRLAASPRVQI